MGKTINDILGFNFDPGTFAGAAAGLSDTVVKSNIQRVKECTDQMLDGDIYMPEIDIKEVYEYLRACYQAKVAPSNVTIDKRQLRTLCYGLEPNDVYEFIKYILAVIQCNWSPTYLRGILHSLLHHWEDLNMDTRIAVSNFLVERIREARSRSARKMSDMAAYLNEEGPRRLGEYLRHANLPFQYALSLFDLASNRINYTFFSGCIVEYYTGSPSDKYGEIRAILNAHNNIKTTKSLIPAMIIAESEKKKVPKELIDFSINMIGDPSIESKWAPFEGATQQQMDNLERAREIINAALAAAVINIFFEKLCEDSKRKNFWLKHTKKIKNFKVYGSSNSQKIMGYEVSKQVLMRHFVTVPSRSNTCALVMYLGEYVIIEFTDVGALYVYHKDSQNYNKVFGKGARIESTDDLKLPYLANLVDTDTYYTHYSDEGRMVHIGHWATRMKNWLNAKIK